MTASHLLRAMLVTAMMASIGVLGSARAAEPEVVAFAKEAVQGNLAEIELGKLAHEKAGSDALKAYGQLIVDDRNKANAALTPLVKDMNVSIPLAPNDNQKQMSIRLAKEPTKTFDTDFVNAMLQDHQNTLTRYEAVAGDKKHPLAGYAAAQVPVLKDHLAKITEIAKGMGI